MIHRIGVFVVSIILCISLTACSKQTNNSQTGTAKSAVVSVQHEYAAPLNIAEALLHSISNMDVQGFITLCQWPSEAEAESQLNWIYQNGTPYTFEEMDWVPSYDLFGNMDGMNGYLKAMKATDRSNDNWTTHIGVSYNRVRKVYTVGLSSYIGTNNRSAYLAVPPASNGD